MDQALYLYLLLPIYKLIPLAAVSFCQETTFASCATLRWKTEAGCSKFHSGRVVHPQVNALIYLTRLMKLINWSGYRVKTGCPSKEMLSGIIFLVACLCLFSAYVVCFSVVSFEINKETNKQK